MGDHHLFVGSDHPAGVPGGHLRRGRGAGELGLDIAGRPGGEDQTFQQRVAGHAVGAVQPGVGDLADGIESGQIGTRPVIGDHPTTGVVGGGDHRDGRAGDIETIFQALGVDGREVFEDEVRRSVGDVQVDALGAQALHLVVDGAGDDIAGGEFGALVEAGHEAVTVGQQQAPPLAAQGLGDQKGPCLRVIEAGGMKLHELHVGYSATCAPGHGDAIPGGDIRVAGIEVDLAGPAGSDDHEAGEQRLDLTAGLVEDIGPQAAVELQAQLPGAEEVHGDVALEELDVVAGAGSPLEGGFHLFARGIRGVDDAAMAMPPLPGEVIAPGVGGAVIAGEGNALIEQPADAVRAVLHHQLHLFWVTEPGTGVQGVLNVGGQGILGIEYRRDAPLGIEGTALAQVPFGHQGDGQGRWQA